MSHVVSPSKPVSDVERWRHLMEPYWPASWFPADAPTLLAYSMLRHTPGSLWWLLNRLPQDQRFESLDDLLDALNNPAPRRPTLTTGSRS